MEPQKVELKARDILWKGIIEDLFPDFLRFFYGGADQVFDIDKGFEFLDKELGQLYPGQDARHPKFVDKLVKVYRKDGTEEMMLIHIEVQGYRDKTFPRRMFTYFYRILDRFDKESASIAIFTDNNKNYRPGKYEYHSLETSNVFQFKTYKVKGQDRSILEKSDNPFAMVVLTVLIWLRDPHKRQEDMLNLSLDLARRMFRKGFTREKITSLLDFLKSYVYLDAKKIFFKFDQELDFITKNQKTMGIRELATLLIRDEGMKDGMEQGLKDGMTEGLKTARVTLVTNLLLKSDHTIQEIAEFADVPVDFVSEIKNKLN